MQLKFVDQLSTFVPEIFNGPLSRNVHTDLFLTGGYLKMSLVKFPAKIK